VSQQFATEADFDDLGLPPEATVGLTSPRKVKFLKRASAMLAGRMAPKKVAPFTSWGDDLNGYTCDVAAWLVLMRDGTNPKNETEAARYNAYVAALAWAESVGKGEIEPIDLVDATPNDDEGAPMVSSCTPDGWLDDGGGFS